MADIITDTTEMNKEHIQGTYEYNGQVYNYDFIYDKNNPNTGLDIFYHGYYGGRDVAAVMRNGDYNVQPILNSYSTSQSSGLIVYHNYNLDYQSYLEVCDLIAQDVSNKYGVTFNNINRSGASYGDNYALAASIKYNLENDIQTPNFVSLYGDRIWEEGNPFSGTNNGYINTLTEEELHSALGNTYLVAYGDNDSIDRIKDYTAGVICIKGPGLDHDNGYKNAMKLNSVDFCNGYSDLVLSDKYKISYYSSESGWINDISLEELKEMLPDMSSGIKTVYNLNSGSSIDIIQSDGSFLSNEMSDISRMLKATKINNETVSINSLSSTTSVPSTEPEIAMKMLNACKVLFEKIYTELVMINEVGEEFATMDNFLSNMSSNIGMDVQSVKIPSVTLESMPTKDFNYEIPEEIINITNKLKEEYGVPITDDSTTSNNSSSTPSHSSSGSNSSSWGGTSYGNYQPSSPTQTEGTTNNEPSKDESQNNEIPKDDVQNSELPNENPSKEETSNNEPLKDESQNNEVSKEEPSKEETSGNVQKDEPQKNESSNSSSKPNVTTKPSTSKKPSTSNKPNVTNPNPSDEKPPIVEIPDESVEPEESVIPDEPITPDEPTIPEESIIPDAPVIPSTSEDESKSGSVLKTVGGLVGIGAAVGAGVYATHKVVENKSDKNDYSDYDYESDNENIDSEEDDNMPASPFTPQDNDVNGGDK